MEASPGAYSKQSQQKGEGTGREAGTGRRRKPYLAGGRPPGPAGGPPGRRRPGPVQGLHIRPKRGTVSGDAASGAGRAGSAPDPHPGRAAPSGLLAHHRRPVCAGLRRDCEELLADPILRSSAGQWGGFLWRAQGEGFLLAAPLECHRPFPLPPLFCLGRVEDVQGRPHVVWRFDREGNPVLPD